MLDHEKGFPDHLKSVVAEIQSNWAKLWPNPNAARTGYSYPKCQWWEMVSKRYAAKKRNNDLLFTK